MNRLLTCTLLLASSFSALAATEPPANTDDHARALPLEKIAPYPQAKPGMIRQVITVPARQNEEQLKVELLIGKTLEVDCNHQMIAGELKRETLSGWGYDYFVVEKLSQPASTMMACPDKQKKSLFVAANLGTDSLQRYNSRLPIVVYVAQGVEVKYRIWQTTDKISRAIEK